MHLWETLLKSAVLSGVLLQIDPGPIMILAREGDGIGASCNIESDFSGQFDNNRTAITVMTHFSEQRIKHCCRFI